MNSDPPDYPSTTRVSSFESTASIFSDNSISTSGSRADSQFSSSSTATHLTSPPNPSFAGLDTVQPHLQGPSLPCEFSLYTPQCGLVFELHEENEWIGHHYDHLRNDLPKKLRCPLCDEWVFDYKELGRDRERNFSNRMRHWSGHYTSGDPFGSLRSDHLMVEHLWKKKLIELSEYRRLMDLTEMSPEIRAPVASGAKSQDYITPREETRRRQENQVVISQASEDRNRRKKKGVSAKAGRGYPTGQGSSHVGMES